MNALTHSFEPTLDTARDYRHALGRFGTGVTVVTCDTGDGPLGITANSFASVSLDPPLVLWSPAKSSSRFSVFAEARDFAIHVLGADQRDLAAHFVRNGTDFSGLDLADSADATPVLLNCLAHFVCRRVALHDAGDHVIVVGEVRRCAFREGAPLVFSQGAYGNFARGH